MTSPALPSILPPAFLFASGTWWKSCGVGEVDKTVAKVRSSSPRTRAHKSRASKGDTSPSPLDPQQ